MNNIVHYLTADGRDLFQEWLTNLADRQARARVLVRIQRMADGNYGDCRPISDGMWELRIDYGTGYRVYYSIVGEEVVLLLVGGDKRKQVADIDAALKYLQDWKRRNPK